MATRTSDYLKGKFEAGDVPSSSDFVDFIDSTYSVGVSSLSGAISITEPTFYNNLILNNFATSTTATSGSSNIPVKAHGFISLTVNNSSIKIPYFV